MSRVEFIHISDLHYQTEYSSFARKLSAQTGGDFTEQLRRSLAHILARVPDVAFFLLSGDLVHEGTAAEYRELHRLWDEICGRPVYAVPGNHDSDACGIGFWENEADCAYIHEASGLRIIGMDSRGGEYSSGLLSEAQLEWLREQLKDERDSVLMIHHTPHISGEEEFLIWQMQNPQALYDVVCDANILGIFTGHTHRTFESMLGRIPCYTVNSVTHGIDATEERMVVSNQTGYNHCVYENGKLTVEHIDIPVEKAVEIVVLYSELGEE